VSDRANQRGSQVGKGGFPRCLAGDKLKLIGHRTDPTRTLALSHVPLVLRYNLAMYVLKVRSREREELVEFTDEVQQQLTASGEQEGVVVLYVQHTTAGLTVNENADPDVPRDMLHLLRTLIPQQGMGFRHGEENSDAHIKATLVGSSVNIPFKDGKLLLGRWQGIFLCEFDGGRERQVIMMVR
jgi:secondary thiamine-phosphate synthase enzyme